MRHRAPQKQFFNKRALFIIHLHSFNGLVLFLVDSYSGQVLSGLPLPSFFGFLSYLITRKACNNWLARLICPVISRKYGNFR